MINWIPNFHQLAGKIVLSVSTPCFLQITVNYTQKPETSFSTPTLKNPLISGNGNSFNDQLCFNN